MPCRSYGDEPSYSSSGSRETQNKMDMLARMACRALTALETINEVSGRDIKDTVDIGATINAVLEDPEVAVWWPKHKIADAAEQAKKRKFAEDAANLAKAKKVALAKLTKEEKKILGVK
jgi:hypothetical protein